MKLLIGKAAIILLVLLTGITGRVQAQGYTLEQVRQIYLDGLANDGYRPEVTKGGNIQFRREGQSFYVVINADDLKYFNLRTAYLVEDKSEPARIKRLEAINYANTQTKVSQASIDSDGDLVCAIELYLADPNDMAKHLNRMLASLGLLYKNYQKKMSE